MMNIDTTDLKQLDEFLTERGEENSWRTNGGNERHIGFTARVRSLASNMEDEIARLTRERDEARQQGEKDLARAIDSELRCNRAMGKYRAERDRAHQAEQEIATLRAEVERLRTEASKEPDDCDNCANPMDGDAASTSDVCWDCWRALRAEVERLREELAATKELHAAEGAFHNARDTQELVAAADRKHAARARLAALEVKP